jgi:hypothetical protein
MKITTLPEILIPQVYIQGDLHLPDHDTDQRQCGMAYHSLATLLHQHLVKKFKIH